VKSRSAAARKVLHLKRLAKRAGAHEAKAAAKAAERIMAEFALDDADVTNAAKQDVEVDREPVLVSPKRWQGMIAEASAMFCGADLMVQHRHGKLHCFFRGTESQRDAATALYARLAKVVDGLRVPVSFSVWSGGGENANWRDSFFLGVGVGIAEIVRAKMTARDRPKPGAMILRPVEVYVAPARPARADEMVAATEGLTETKSAQEAAQRQEQPKFDGPQEGTPPPGAEIVDGNAFALGKMAARGVAGAVR
jgi:hypothetical protein